MQGTRVWWLVGELGCLRCHLPGEHLRAAAPEKGSLRTGAKTWLSPASAESTQWLLIGRSAIFPGYVCSSWLLIGRSAVFPGFLVMFVVPCPSLFASFLVVWCFSLVVYLALFLWFLCIYYKFLFCGYQRIQICWPRTISACFKLVVI